MRGRRCRIGAFVNLVNVPLLYVIRVRPVGAACDSGVAGAALAAGLAFTIGAVILVGLW